MREIEAAKIVAAVAGLYAQACLRLPEPVKQKLYAFGNEAIIKNFETNGELPLCQDTGLAAVYLEIGQDVHIVGDIAEAVNEGVRRAVKGSYLRASVVSDPLRRVNTGDNTPAVLYMEFVPGDTLKVTVTPRGFGCENKARLAMLTPGDGIEGVKAFILETVNLAVPDACPPIVVGAAIGGTFDRAACLSKKAVLRTGPNPDPFYAEMERELFEKVKNVALAVNIVAAPTHIAGLPCAVSIGCHSLRWASEVIV